jgi:hypothetical protein
MFEIKADPNLPYHYIIGVSIHTPFSKDYGKLYLKYFLEFHHEDIEKVRTALRLSKDRKFPSGITQSDALKIADCESIVGSIHALKISAASNNATMHHFSSPVKLEDSFFEDLIDRANTNKHDKKLLDDSRI